MAAPDFPILGTEPVSVELANTLYGSGVQRVDFLHSADWIDRWFALICAAHDLPTPVHLGQEAQRVRALRDCVHHLLSAAADAGMPETDMLDRLNDFAAAAPTYPQLVWADGRRRARRLDLSASGTAALGHLAADCIEVLTAPPSRTPRRCTGPGCSMLYVKNHPRRRWCHPSCGHRDRQARYYRRRTTTEAPP